MISKLMMTTLALAVFSCVPSKDSQVKDAFATDRNNHILLYKYDGKQVIVERCYEARRQRSVEALIEMQKCPNGVQIVSGDSLEKFRKKIESILPMSVTQFVNPGHDDWVTFGLELDLYNKHIAGIDGGPEQPEAVKKINKLIDRLLEAIVSKGITYSGSFIHGFHFIVGTNGYDRTYDDAQRALLGHLLGRYVELAEYGFKPITVDFPHEFSMGGREDLSLGRSSNKPHHKVKLTHPFEVGETEVTQKMWVDVMGSNPSYFVREKHCGISHRYLKWSYHDPYRGYCPHNPVENVSWNDVQVFIGKMNARQGLDCGDTATDVGFEKARRTPGCYRLPTEAEWEFFASSGGYALGYEPGFNYKTVNYHYSVSNEAYSTEYIDHPDPIHVPGHRAANVTLPVRRSMINHFKIYETSGNVSEWTQGWYYKYSKETAVDPIATNPHESGRVIRDCSYTVIYDRCVRVRRYVGSPDDRAPHLGFRLVRSK